MPSQAVNVNQTRDFELYNQSQPIDLKYARLGADTAQQQLKLRITPLANELMEMIFDRDRNGKQPLATLSRTSCDSKLGVQNLKDLVVQQNQVILMGDQGSMIAVDLVNAKQIDLARRIIELANEIFLTPSELTAAPTDLLPTPFFGLPEFGPLSQPTDSLLPQALAANEQLAKVNDWLVDQNHGLGRDLEDAKKRLEKLQRAREHLERFRNTFSSDGRNRRVDEALQLLREALPKPDEDDHSFVMNQTSSDQNIVKFSEDDVYRCVEDHIMIASRLDQDPDTIDEDEELTRYALANPAPPPPA